MKILMVSSFLPYPLFSGGHIRLFNIIKELSKNHEITLVCEKRDYQKDEDLEKLSEICKKVIAVNRKKQWTIGNLLKTSTSKNSFLVNGHTNPDLKKAILGVLSAQKFDLIHAETYYISQNIPKVTIPIVLIEHNIEHQVYRKYANKAPIFLRPLLFLDIAKIKKEEEKNWQKAKSVVVVSKEDQKVIKTAGINASIVANGVDVDKFKFMDRKGKNNDPKILFIGDFKWIQNRDSVMFIVNEIWPKIKLKAKSQKLKENIKLWIVGRKIPNSIKSLTNDPDIIFDESSSANPTEQIFQDAYVLLSPIRVGGGTSYKILESMSCGTPVVTTPMSAEAIEAKDGEEILIGKNSDELSDKVLQLLNNNIFYEQISKKGSMFIKENYTWRKITKDLEKVYKSVL